MSEAEMWECDCGALNPTRTGPCAGCKLSTPRRVELPRAMVDAAVATGLDQLSLEHAREVHVEEASRHHRPSMPAAFDAWFPGARARPAEPAPAPAERDTVRVSAAVEYEWATDRDGAFVRASWVDPVGYKGMPERIYGPFMRTREAAARALLCGIATDSRLLARFL